VDEINRIRQQLTQNGVDVSLVKVTDTATNESAPENPMNLRLSTVLSGLLIALRARAAPVEGPTRRAEAGPAGRFSGKVEVIEFFCTAVPTATHSSPISNPGVKRLPRDVQFKRIPGILNEDWAVDARVFLR
jgi:hypothetical protein